MKYTTLDLGTIEAVFNKLGGIEGAQAFLRGQTLPSFERNEHGHVIITVTGLGLSGAQEIERLIAAGYRVSDYAKSCLLSKKKDGYDAMHTLVPNREYKVALMPGKEIERDSNRTTENLRRRGMEKYGYDKPLAGLIPRIRESVSDKQMEEIGVYYLAGLHSPIEDSVGASFVLFADRYDDGQWLNALFDDPGLQWDDVGLFAFPVSAS